jgi:hypothetical protein
MKVKEAIQALNELGPPDHDHPENGGRVSWGMVHKYGEWLYRRDKTAFHYAKKDLEAR